MDARRYGSLQLDRQNGFVLFPVLLLLLLVSVLLATLQTFAVNSRSVLVASRINLELEQSSKGAVELAMSRIVGQGITRTLKGNLSAVIGPTTTRVTWQGEYGRLDLNKVPIALLRALLRRTMDDEQSADTVAAALLQRRKQTAAGTGQGPQRAADLADVGQLESFGVPHRVMLQIQNELTVFGSNVGIDPRFASANVLASLPGVTEGKVRDLLALQARGTNDVALWKLSAGDAAPFIVLNDVQPIRLFVEARQSGGALSQVEAVVTILTDDTEPFRYLLWKDMDDMGSGAVR